MKTLPTKSMRLHISHGSCSFNNFNAKEHIQKEKKDKMKKSFSDLSKRQLFSKNIKISILTFKIELTFSGYFYGQGYKSIHFKEVTF